VILAFLALYGWFMLPDHSWDVLGPNLVIAAIQLTAGLIITEILLVHYRKKRLYEVAGWKIRSCTDHIKYSLYQFTWDFHIPTSRKRLRDMMEPEIRDLQKEVNEVLERYQGFLDFETIAILQEINDSLMSLSFASRSYSNMDDEFMRNLVGHIEDLYKNVRRLGKQLSSRDTDIKKWIKEMKDTRIEHGMIDSIGI